MPRMTKPKPGFHSRHTITLRLGISRLITYPSVVGSFHFTIELRQAYSVCAHVSERLY